MITRILLLPCLWLKILSVEAQNNTVVDKIIAKIDNHIILRSDVEIGYQQMLSSGQTLPPDAKCEIFKSLVVNKILVAKADIDSIIVAADVVESELDRRMQYFIAQAGGRNKLEQTLGKSVTQLKAGLRDQVREQLVTQQVRQTITEDIGVTPDEVRKYFKNLPKDSIPFLSAEVQAGQIVKYADVSPAEKEKVKKQLFDIKQRLLDGEDFASLARTYSEDFGSRARGGDLGWAGRGTMVPEFEATALRIKENKISDPIESEFGYHLIQLLERRGNRFHARHILIRPKSTETDVERAIQFMDSIKNLMLIDSLTFEKAAKEFSDDPPTRANSGYFQDSNTGSSIVSTDDLDPVIFFILDTMKVGNITAPLPFRSEDGKQAVRLIYYKSYAPPHYANLKDDYQKIYNAAQEYKNYSVLEEWLNKAKKQVFIDIDPAYEGCDIINKL